MPKFIFWILSSIAFVLCLANLWIFSQRVTDSQNERVIPDHEKIQSLAVELLVRKDRSLLVTESIALYVTRGGPFEHGIVRPMPHYRDRYREEEKQVIEYAVKSASVVGRGVSIPTDQRALGDYHALFFGDQDTRIPIGKQTFSFQYELRNLIVSKEEVDKIVWPVTGYLFGVPVKSLAAVVRLPELVDPKSVRLHAYTRKMVRGKKEYQIEEFLPVDFNKVAFKIESDPDGTNARARFWISRSLDIDECLFIEVSWPKGFL